MTKQRERPLALLIAIAIFIVYLALAVGLAVKGSSIGLSGDKLLIVELSLFCVLLILILLSKFFEAILLLIASLRATRWFMRYDAEKASPPGGTADNLRSQDSAGSAKALQTALVHRFGLRWRHRARWILVAGERSVVDRIAPGLSTSGWQMIQGAVLLHGCHDDGQPDVEWLRKLRRLRRHRPVDAVVACTEVLGPARTPFDAEGMAQRLVLQARTLCWSAPVYLVDAVRCTGNISAYDASIGVTWSDRRSNSAELETTLTNLAGSLAGNGVARLARDPLDRAAAEMSQHIERFRAALRVLLDTVGTSGFWRSDVHGLLFAPICVEQVEDADREVSEQAFALPSYDALWKSVLTHSRAIYGRRVGVSLSSAAAYGVIVVLGIFVAGTLLSGFVNRSMVRTDAGTLESLSSAKDPEQRLQALNALDKQLDTLEIRSKEGAPLYTRFGLNHDAALYQRLWPAYLNAASRVLIVPIKAKLENRLSQLASLSDAEIASGGNAQVQAAYDTLKTYLMLANPEHADATFLTTQLLATNEPARQQNATLTQGAWEDLRQHAIAFYASHLKHGASPALTPDAALIASARQTIIGVRGIQNSTDAIYQQIIDETKPKYPPLTLAGILGDHPSRGLFGTSATVPGVFTRAAWEERIPKAIDEASEHHTVAGDWVLSDAKADNTSPSALKAELRQRYFDDYFRAWAQFLNGIRWQDASSLSGTVDQLTLLGDPQRSPLVALMDAIVYQAGAGASTQTLSDSLITKAQQLVGADEKDPSKRAQARITPLAEAFGPVLRLTGSDLVAAASVNGKGVPQPVGDLSLPRYLERVTAMRLRTQQMMSSPDPDAMSRAAAQAMLQGKTSDIADSRDYASRVSASLGERWAGFGKLFEAPFDQTWQVVVRPASASLNDIWRTAILADWNRNFASRYPFADSDNDASLPDLARFLRLDNGVIAQFVATQLAGIIERQGDHWAAAQGANQGALTLDPAFLIALNKLTRVSTVMFPSGDAHVRFDLRGVPTPGVTEMTFVLAGRTFKYFNQQEEWMPFEWPGQSLENVTHLEWETAQGGLRSALDAQGRFGVIRLLERAKVTQQDSARYLLSWTPDQSQALPLSVQMRAEGGAGPLDVLVLRHFALPERVFLVNNPAKTKATSAASNPPPLPPGAFTAANQLGIPLPQGATTEMH